MYQAVVVPYTSVPLTASGDRHRMICWLHQLGDRGQNGWIGAGLTTWLTAWITAWPVTWLTTKLTSKPTFWGSHALTL